MPHAPLLALLTDFGTSDGYVGVMKGVILGIAPGLPLVDLSHEVPPQDAAAGAWVLGASWRFFPRGSVFLCVVDPGVGSARRPVALAADGYAFVGPDNGLFTPVLAAGPVEVACVLDHPAFHWPQPSATFHGRDIFAPCAAHLAAGVPLPELGSPIDPATLVRLPATSARWENGALVATVAHVDHFGNLITNITSPWTERVLAQPSATLVIEETPITKRGQTFADGPEGRPFLLPDSSGALAIAVRNGSASRALGLGQGARVRVVGLSTPA